MILYLIAVLLSITFAKITDTVFWCVLKLL